MHEGHSGTAAQLTSLYEAHATDAFRYALHLTGRREDAEDAVQFVFLRAYGMLESGTELVNPRAWLMKATKHRSLNMLRDRREAPMADAELPVGPRYDPDPTEAEALAEVRSTLWALPESQHHAFVLRHWSGLSQDEIADVLGTTAGAVESLLVRARTTLLEDREQGAAECATVRRRLVQALVPTPAHEAHIATCRRCRTAQTRLLRASEFATAFALVPRPYVVHALASVIPGFGASATAAAGGAAGAGAGGSAGVGGGAGIAAASAATKLALASKVALVTATAVVTLGAAHPVRRAVERAVLGAPSAAPAAHRSAGAASTVGTAGIQGAGTGAATGSSHASPKAQAKGKGQTTPAGGNGKAQGKAKGKPAAAGSNGAGKGKSASAGSNGKATGKPGSAGSSNGKSATAGSKGKAKGKTSTSAGSSGSTGSSSAPGQSGTKPHGKG